MSLSAADSAETERLLDRIRAGEKPAVERLFDRHRPYLRRLIELRLDPKLRPRVDPSDVVQEAQMEAHRQLKAYLRQPTFPFRLWLRQLAYDRLARARRFHLETEKRAVARDLPLPDRSSLLLAREFLAAGLSPSQQLLQREFVRRVREAIGRLAEGDREVLILRKLEGLSNQETAQLLDIDPATASRRFGRAVLRLRDILIQAGLMESEP
jgi:RNA polymerase sigma-70 factor (ECF subfamily)